MSNRDQWEEIKPLGGGGQSDVFLVRRPSRKIERHECLAAIRPAIDRDKSAALASAIWTYARPEEESELGALKLFKIAPSLGFQPLPGSEEDEAVQRLENEIKALERRSAGLPELLGSDLDERWLVTEFFPHGTLERSPERYKGDALRTLEAFRSVLKTAASLHEEGIVHRDIKPANVFVKQDDELVLGDFGIVFVPNERERLTLTNERVGPRDYMPPWGDLGTRLEDVRPSFDVYMLGKLLWCMVSGGAKLPREFQKRPQFSLVEMFPGDPAMEMINSILDCSVVEDESRCLKSGGEMLALVDRYLAILRKGGQLLSDNIRRTCRVCGEGTYISDPTQVVGQSLYDPMSRPSGSFYAEYFVCDRCGHLELFRTKRRIP
jgi:serine/threonine protein kinase